MDQRAQGHASGCKKFEDPHPKRQPQWYYKNLHCNSITPSKMHKRGCAILGLIEADTATVCITPFKRLTTPW